MNTRHPPTYQRYKDKLAVIQKKHLDKMAATGVRRAEPLPPPSPPDPDAVDLVMHFDGGCSVNPGGQMTYGFHIDAADGRRVAEGGGPIPGYPDHERTNNTAEFTALLMGLEWVAVVRFIRIGTLTVYGDSRLAVEGVAGRMKVTRPHLVTLRDDCQAAARRVRAERVVFEWVPRERNHTADRIAATSSPVPAETGEEPR